MADDLEVTKRMTDIDVGKKVEELEKLAEKWEFVEGVVIDDAYRGSGLINSNRVNGSVWIQDEEQARELVEAHNETVAVLCAELKKAREERAEMERLYRDLAHYAIGWLMTSECHHKDDDVCVSRKELETRANNAFDWVNTNGKRVPKDDPPSVVALAEKQRLVDELVEGLRECVKEIRETRNRAQCAVQVTWLKLEDVECLQHRIRTFTDSKFPDKATALISRVKGG